MCVRSQIWLNHVKLQQACIHFHFHMLPNSGMEGRLDPQPVLIQQTPKNSEEGTWQSGASTTEGEDLSSLIREATRLSHTNTLGTVSLCPKLS